MTLAKAQQRLECAAITIGSCLVDEIDPDWDSQVELEAACIEYVTAIRADNEREAKTMAAIDQHVTATDRMAVHRALVELDGGGK